MSKNVIHVKKRDVSVKPKHIRDSGSVPANMYGLGKSVALQMNHNIFQRELRLAGDASLVYLEIEGQKLQVPVLIDEVATTPVGSKLTHVTFRKVDMKETVTTDVVVEMIGEVTLNNALVMQVRDSLEITALPADIPEKFEINLDLIAEIGQTLTTADLSFDTTKITIEGLSEDQTELPLVTVRDEAAAAEAQEAAADEAADSAGVVTEEGASEETADSKEEVKE